MKVLQFVKYYEPSKGGMQSVVKDIVTGVSRLNADYGFMVYCNNHVNSYSTIFEEGTNAKVIREKTPLFFKSQPISFGYKELTNLVSQCDIVHEHYPFPTAEYALLRNKNLLKNKKLVITWHANIENSRWKSLKHFYQPLMKKIIQRADKIIVTSPQLVEYSKYLQSAINKIEVIPLSVNLPKDKSIKFKKLPTQGETVKIMFAGKLREYKGVKYLIQAMAYNNFRLDIVGNGPLEKELKKLAKNLNISDRIFFHSNISDDELYSFYKEAHIFVLPSIKESEAFGIVQLEAMSFGTPVINTNLKSGVPFVSLHNETGLTVPPCDPEGLSLAIKQLAENHKLYETCSKNSLERINLFSVEKMAKSYLNIYNTIS